MHDGAVCEKLSAHLPTKLKHWSIQQSPRYQYEQPALLKRDTYKKDELVQAMRAT